MKEERKGGWKGRETNLEGLDSLDAWEAFAAVTAGRSGHTLQYVPSRKPSFHPALQQDFMFAHNRQGTANASRASTHGGQGGFFIAAYTQTDSLGALPNWEHSPSKTAL